MASLGPFPGLDPEAKAQAGSSRTLTASPAGSLLQLGASSEEEGHCAAPVLRDGEQSCPGDSVVPVPLGHAVVVLCKHAEHAAQFLCPVAITSRGRGSAWHSLVARRV